MKKSEKSGFLTGVEGGRGGGGGKVRARGGRGSKLGEWCFLNNDPKLVMGQPTSR